LVVAGSIASPSRADTAISSAASTATTRSTARAGGNAAIVGLTGSIDDYNRDSFMKRFKAAKAAGATTIIVDLDTWGGLVTAGLELSSFLKSQHDVHTIAYINPRGISAGAMIAMACDEIVMGDSAMIGDCAPIAFKTDGSLDPLPPAERAKQESPIAADFYESAMRNHHDPLLAEAMVRVDAVVYWLQSPTGERSFVNQSTYDKLTKDGWKPVEGVPNPVDPADRLLTVHSELAVKLGLASGKANTVEQLTRERNLTVIESLYSGFGEAAVAWLNGGFVRMLLITIFGASIYAALHAPGHGTAEALAVTSLGLLLGVPLLAGYATWWEILLILGGLAMIAFEIFVFPHSGSMVVAGVLMMVVGLILTFVGGEPGGSRVFPKLPGTLSALKQGLAFVTGGLICSALLSAWLSRYLPKIPYFSRLVLTATVGGSSSAGAVTGLGVVPAPKSTWPPVGSVGRAVTPLKPGGSAEFPDVTGTDSLIFSVVSESGFLPIGAPIVVREVGGGRLVVRSTTA
jgi:membrane-bound serine protease (ClpP class)